jgi:hypothetical protein
MSPARHEITPRGATSLSLFRSRLRIPLMEADWVRHTILLVGMVAAGCLVTPAESAAQTSATAGAPAIRIPRVMISAALGITNDRRGFGNRKPMLPTVSVQFLPIRHLVVEGEFGWWKETWDHRSTYNLRRGAVTGELVQVGMLEGWWGGVNVLYRTEPRRVSLFVGGGAFLDFEHYDDIFRLEGCVSTSPDGCWGPNKYEHRHTSLHFQGVAGADVHIAGPIRAYGSVHYNTMYETAYLRAFGGVRFVAVSRRAASGSN